MNRLRGFEMPFGSAIIIRYQMMTLCTRSGRDGSCEGDKGPKSMGNAQRRIVIAEQEWQTAEESFQRDVTNSTGLQALAAVACACEKIGGNFSFQAIVHFQGCQVQPVKTDGRRKMPRSGHAKRLEPESPRLVETNDQVRDHFAHAGWSECIRKFQGFDTEVTEQFILSLNGNTVTVKDFSFRISEDFISEAIGVPRQGEAWFKNAALTEVDLNHFMKPEHENPPWALGFPREFLTYEWNAVDRTVRQYFTCEGRYSTVHLYHLRFLAHVAGMKPLDLPFFLYKSLTKMVAKARSPQGLKPKLVFHQGLIWILFKYARQRGAKPVLIPRGENMRRAAAASEDQTSGPAVRTRARAQDKMKQKVESEVPIMAGTSQPEASTPNPADRAPDRTRETHGQWGGSQQ